MKKFLGILVLGLLFCNNSFGASEKKDLVLTCYDTDPDMMGNKYDYKISYKENKIYVKSSDGADSYYPIISEDDFQIFAKSVVPNAFIAELIFHKDTLIIEETTIIDPEVVKELNIKETKHVITKNCKVI